MSEQKESISSELAIKLAESEKLVAALKKQVAGLENDLKLSANSNKDLKNIAGDLEDDLKEAVAINTDLQKKLEAKPITAQNAVVKVGNQEYQVLARNFQFEGKQYTAEELAKNPELVEKLVKAGVGILKAI